MTLNSDRWLQRLALIAAILVWLKHGGYTGWVPLLIVAAMAWIGSDALAPRDAAPTTRGIAAFRYAPVVLWLLFAGSTRLRDVAPAGADLPLQLLGLLGAAASFAAARAPRHGARLLGLCSLLLLGACFYVPTLSPDPFIDVFRSNRLALEHFVAGRNVYAQTYPDIYGGKYDYAPGFLYWPGTLLALWPGHFLGGDLRYSLAGCLAILVLAMAWALRAEKKPLSAGAQTWMFYWLALPFLAFVIEQAWIDPILAVQTVVAILAARRGWLVTSAIAAGLMLATKQYGFLLPLFLAPFLWREWGFRRAAIWSGIAGAVFLAVMVPFVLPDAEAFFRMTVSGHAEAKPRFDALNFTALLARLTGYTLPSPVQALASLVGIGIGLRGVLRARRGAWHRVPWAMAQAFLLSVLFGKFAFGNYYFLALTWIALGAVLQAVETEPAPAPRS